MFEFKLPDLGEGIHEGELLQWHVAVGDTVKEDEPLCEMETDKAAVTIPSPRAGVISALNAAPGDTVDVGSVFVVIDDGSGKTAATAQSDPVEAPVPVAPELSSEPVSEDKPKGRVLAAPATRRLAREMGIDITQVNGSGPGGRITPEDLNAYDASGPGTAASPPVADAPDDQPQEERVSQPVDVSGIPFLEVPELPAPDGPVEREPFRSLRNKVAVKMTTSSIIMPHVAHMDDIDVTDIEALRREYNLRQADKGKPGGEASGKLTLLAFVVKAVAAGLKDYPMFNASVDLASREIVYKKYYNIGFAADTPRGLMVPVVHDADRQSLAGVGYRIRHLAGLARNGEISVPELTGGTFTITNVGAIGGTHVFPIINAPESAILGLGRVDKRPVVRGEDKIRVRKILPVTLCFDHRVADGAQAAAFVREVKEMLENSLEFMSRI